VPRERRVGSNPTSPTISGPTALERLCYYLCMPARRYTRELLAPIVARALSVAEVLRVLEIRQTGGSHTHMSRRIRQLGLDTSHFLGQGRNRGSSHTGGPAKKPASQILIENPALAARTPAKKLRRALTEIGRPLKCMVCGMDDRWLGSEITLEVDHINGRHNDNRPENLRLLCPNCHSQTETYCSRNIRAWNSALDTGSPDSGPPASSESHVESTSLRAEAY
jgi:HNH endonuclease